jgi:hypothetical protein
VPNTVPRASLGGRAPGRAPRPLRRGSRRRVSGARAGRSSGHGPRGATPTPLAAGAHDPGRLAAARSRRSHGGGTGASRAGGFEDPLWGPMRLDSVEIKATFESGDVDRAIEKLNLPSGRPRWNIYFCEDVIAGTSSGTPLLDAHIVLRAREKPAGRDDTTIKLRPCSDLSSPIAGSEPRRATIGNSRSRPTGRATGGCWPPLTPSTDRRVSSPPGAAPHQ